MGRMSMTSCLVSMFLRLPCEEKTSGLVGKQTGFRSPKVSLKRERGLYKSDSTTISQSRASDWSQDWSYLPRLLICHATIQCTTVFAASYWMESVVAFRKVVRTAALLSPVAKLQWPQRIFPAGTEKNADVSRRPDTDNRGADNREPTVLLFLWLRVTVSLPSVAVLCPI